MILFEKTKLKRGRWYVFICLIVRNFILFILPSSRPTFRRDSHHLRILWSIYSYSQFFSTRCVLHILWVFPWGICYKSAKAIQSPQSRAKNWQQMSTNPASSGYICCDGISPLQITRLEPMPLLPGPRRRLAPVLKCRWFLLFFQRYFVRDISLTEIYRWLIEILGQSRERL